MMARILLRMELGRRPTDAEVEEQVKKFDEGTSEPPSLRAITAAFDKGEEVRLVLTL
jgi:hypothetical protein